MNKSVRACVLCVGLTPALQELRQFERLRTGTVNRALAVIYSAAGKGVNVGHVLETLGASSLLLGFLGGYTGEMVRRDLERWGVAHDLVTMPQRTRICQTLMDRSTGTITELVEEAALPSRREWKAFYAKYARHLPRAAMVVIAGALMPGATADVYRNLAQMARARSIPVIIDSQKAPLLRVLPLRPLVAKMNVHELENTTGEKLRSNAAILRAARTLIEAGAHNMVVTDGERGAWLIDARAAWHYQPPRLDAVNPIGSGDAVTAGIAFGLWKRRSLVEATRLGIACGAANVLTLTPGTLPKGSVRQLLPRVRCREVGSA